MKELRSSKWWRYLSSNKPLFNNNTAYANIPTWSRDSSLQFCQYLLSDTYLLNVLMKNKVIFLNGLKFASQFRISTSELD